MVCPQGAYHSSLKEVIWYVPKEVIWYVPKEVPLWGNSHLLPFLLLTWSGGTHLSHSPPFSPGGNRRDVSHTPFFSTFNRG